MRIGISAVVALIIVVGLGCQHSSSPAPQTAAPAGHAIIVSGGNTGNAITVFVPSNDPANPAMYCTTGESTCPECKAAAIKYFSTGVLDPKCSRTGATRSIATGIPPNYGHN